MKKKLLLFILAISLVICAFTIVSFAIEIPENTDSYYLVQSMESEAAIKLKAEGKTNIVAWADVAGVSKDEAGPFFNSVSDYSSIEFILAENLVTNNGEYKGITINKPITLTVRYNGYVHSVPNGSRYNGIVLKNSEAHLNLIGSKATDENGNISTEFIKPTMSDGVVTERGNLDVYHSGKVYVWAFSGTVSAENVRSSTFEEFVFTENDVVGTYEFNSCACLSSKCSSIGLQGQKGKIFNVNKGYYYGLCGFSISNGSLVKDAVIDGFGISIDSWHGTPNTWMFENCTVAKVSTATGRTHLAFRDCDLSNTVWSLGGDGWGDQFVRIYTSPTCTEDGTLEIKRSTNKGYPTSYYDDEIANFSSPKLGHSADLTKINGVTYESFLDYGTHIAPCVRCGENAKADQSTALPLFAFLGYSTPEDGSYGIVASYTLNLKAISEYETLTGATLNYGIVAGAKQNLGEINPLDKNGNATTLEKGNVVKAEVSKDYSSFDFVLTEMNENQLDIELVIASYVVVKNGDDVSVVYLQSTQKTENLSVISYNTIPKTE